MCGGEYQLTGTGKLRKHILSEDRLNAWDWQADYLARRLQKLVATPSGAEHELDYYRQDEQ